MIVALGAAFLVRCATMVVGRSAAAAPAFGAGPGPGEGR
jgi:hypothetical protein